MDRPRSFKVSATDEQTTSIYLYDAIDPWWGISAEAFARQLNAIETPNINLRINSPGGDVFEARAIVTAIRQHSANIDSYVDGIAASAASYVALAGKKVEIADGAFFMIHKGWTIEMGNADELRKTASLLDKIDDSIANDYAARTGKSKDELLALMAEETWYSSAEAKEFGFADRIGGSADAQNSGQWNLSAYARVPKALTDKPETSSARDRAALERRMAMLERIAP
nr:head maturation protease, ClpP-related [Paraburkholderia sp. Cy-641]